MTTPVRPRQRPENPFALKFTRPLPTEGSMIQRLKTWWATALAWWRTRSVHRRVAALEETVRKMSDTIFTERIVTRLVTLVDGEGQERGSLVVDDDGTAVLLLLDEDRHVRIGISVKDGQPGICLYDADGPVRAAMTIQNDRATIQVGAGLAQAALTARDDTVATIMTDKDFKPRAILASIAYPFLVLLDAEGKPVFQAPPVDDGDLGWGGLDLKKVFGF